MKRRLAAAVISVALAVPLAGCAADDPDNPTVPGETMAPDFPDTTTPLIPTTLPETTPTTAAP